jgi:hypothetical protein
LVEVDELVYVNLLLGVKVFGTLICEAEHLAGINRTVQKVLVFEKL